MLWDLVQYTKTGFNYSVKFSDFSYICFRRFCVAIKKENYPDYMPSNIFSDSAKQIFRQPGHTIYLLPTVVICNLLPCELEFYVKGMPINGTLKPGKEAALHTADTSQNIELGKILFQIPLSDPPRGSTSI